MYDIRLHRLNVMSHMTIIGLIYNRSFTAKDGTFDAAAAVTLMTNDAEQVMFTADLFHELWSQTIEFSIGMYLLSTQLGWVCVIPVLAVLCMSLQTQHACSLNNCLRLTCCSHIPRQQVCHFTDCEAPEFCQYGYPATNLED